MNDKNQIRAYITRLGRMDAAESWTEGLNPAQRAAMDYLSRANKFSRSPSHIAEFLGTTRGTTSQTLKGLLSKGYVTEERSETDKRSISYDLSAAGRGVLEGKSFLLASLDEMPQKDISQIVTGLHQLLETTARKNGFRSFGICRTCRHHRKNGTEGYCALLEVALKAPQVEQICHEHEPA